MVVVMSAAFLEPELELLTGKGLWFLTTLI